MEQRQAMKSSTSRIKKRFYGKCSEECKISLTEKCFSCGNPRGAHTAGHPHLWFSSDGQVVCEKFILVIDTQPILNDLDEIDRVLGHVWS